MHHLELGRSEMGLRSDGILNHRSTTCPVIMSWGVGEIENDVPIPRVMRARSPLRDLEIGQSILINNYTRESSVRELAYQIGVELQRKFTVRQMSEGVRVWRIG